MSTSTSTFKCGSESDRFQFSITHKTILNKIAASDGPHDVECREIPGFLLSGAMLYTGDKDLLTGSDVIALLDFLLFAEISIDEFGLNSKIILDILNSDKEWTCERANIVKYLCEISPASVVNEWLKAGNIDYAHIVTLRCEETPISKYVNLCELHISNVNATSLIDLSLPKLLKFHCNALKLNTPDFNFGMVPSMGRLEVLDVRMDDIYLLELSGPFGFCPPNRQKQDPRSVTFQNMNDLIVLKVCVTNSLVKARIVGEFPNLEELNYEACDFINFKATRLTKLISRDLDITNLTKYFNECPNVTDMDMFANSYFRDWMDIDNTLGRQFPLLTKLYVKMYYISLSDISITSAKLTSFKLSVSRSAIFLDDGPFEESQHLCDCDKDASPQSDSATVFSITINMPNLRNFYYANNNINVMLNTGPESNYGNHLETCYLKLNMCADWRRVSSGFDSLLRAKNLTIQSANPKTYTAVAIDPALLSNTSKNFRLRYVCAHGHIVPYVKIYGQRWGEIAKMYPHMVTLAARSIEGTSPKGKDGKRSEHPTPKCMLAYYNARIKERIDEFKSISTSVRRYIEAKYKTAYSIIEELAAKIRNRDEYELYSADDGNNGDEEIYDNLMHHFEDLSSYSDHYASECIPLPSTILYSSYEDTIEDWIKLCKAMVAIVYISTIDDIPKLKSNFESLVEEILLRRSGW